MTPTQRLTQIFIVGSFLSIIGALLTGSAWVIPVAVVLAMFSSLFGVKIDLVGFACTSVSWYVSLLNVHLGAGKGRRVYNLFFLSHDFIGWRLEVLFVSLSDDYDKRYMRFKTKIAEGGFPGQKEDVKFTEKLNKSRIQSNIRNA